jgi:cob(I)alamin adenosyltransferase
MKNNEKERHSLVIVHTGEGKGKTTAAMGMALRAAGHDFKVLMIQFIKGGWEYGELTSIKKLNPNFKIVPMGTGFTNLGHRKPNENDIKIASHAWEYSKERIASGEYDMIILDEINYAVSYGLIPVDEVVEAVRSRPRHTHMVLTGRNADPKIIEMADLVTEMKLIKHPFRSGIKAQEGIEF